MKLKSNLSNYLRINHTCSANFLLKLPVADGLSFGLRYI